MRPRWLRTRKPAVHVDVLRIQPGDTLIASTPANLTREAAAHFARQLERYFPGHNAVVLDGGWTLGVARHASQDKPRPASRYDCSDCGHMHAALVAGNTCPSCDCERLPTLARTS